ncbi:MAG: HAD family hydrolase [Pseudomonadales bacterium]|nr:HAD family hydrolase [Pseudomonadales bacterium]NRA17968.1 HAD family hydrolase [Oceanospirillaceae bacterium]
MNCIFFDLDNTLTERAATITAYADQFENDFNQVVKPALHRDRLAKAFNAIDCGGYTTYEKRADDMLALDIWESKPSVTELSLHWQTWVSKNALPMHGLYECLEALIKMGLRLCLVSNGQSKIQRATVMALQLEPYFEQIVISEEVGAKKPDSVIFEVALQKMHCSATEAIFVGDHPLNDYIGSQRQGFSAVWFGGFHTWPADQEQPKRVIKSLSELYPIVRELIPTKSLTF